MTYQVEILRKGTCSLYVEDVWVVKKVLQGGEALVIATFREHEVAAALVGIISQSEECACGADIKIALPSVN